MLVNQKPTDQAVPQGGWWALVGSGAALMLSSVLPWVNFLGSHVGLSFAQGWVVLMLGANVVIAGLVARPQLAADRFIPKSFPATMAVLGLAAVLLAGRNLGDMEQLGVSEAAGVGLYVAALGGLGTIVSALVVFGVNGRGWTHPGRAVADPATGHLWSESN